MNIFNTKDLINSMLLQQAVYCERKNIDMPEILKEKLETATIEEKAEAEASLIEAENLVNEMEWRKCGKHKDINPDTMWGCPDCLAELRKENKELKTKLSLPVEAGVSNVANEYKELGRWIEEYKQCSCTMVAKKKKDLLGYCKRHGTNRKYAVKLLNAIECGYIET